MNEVLTGVGYGLIIGTPFVVWLTWPRRTFGALVALAIAEAAAALVVSVLQQHPPRPAQSQPPVIVRPPTAPAGGRTCAAGSGRAEDWSVPAPAAPHTVAPAVPVPAGRGVVA